MVKFTDSGITESSGLAMSYRFANTLYTFNDENEAKQVKVVNSKTGSTNGSFKFSSSTFEDPEAICIEPTTYKLWLADIGDNNNSRTNIHLTSIDQEPGPGNHGTITSQKYEIKYPFGPKNAETLMIHPTTLDKYIITKGNNNGLLVKFEYGTLSSEHVNTAKLISKSMPAMVADGTFTIDGQWLLLRCAGVRKTIVMKFSTRKIVGYIDGPQMKKCEGITMARDGKSFWLSSEGKYAPLYNIALPGPYRPKATSIVPFPLSPLCN